MTPSIAKTGIVIPYYRGQHYIQKCVYSILDSLPENSHIYIVDNDPDGINEKEVKSEYVTIVRCRPGIGYGRAANAGAYRAISDGAAKIIVTNQDTIFEKQCLRSLLRSASNKTITEVHIPIIKTYDLSQIEPHFSSRILPQTSYVDDLAKQTLKSSYPVTLASAACIALHSHIIKEIGLFDPVFHMYGEDDDFFERLHRNSGSLLLIPDAAIGHFHAMVNASEAEKKIIRKHQDSALDILTIRHGDSIGKYLWHASKTTFRALVLGGYENFSSQFYIHFNHLLKWQTLKSNKTEDVKRRIKNAIKEDLLNG